MHIEMHEWVICIRGSKIRVNLKTIPISLQLGPIRVVIQKISSLHYKVQSFSSQEKLSAYLLDLHTS